MPFLLLRKSCFGRLATMCQRLPELEKHPSMLHGFIGLMDHASHLIRSICLCQEQEYIKREAQKVFRENATETSADRVEELVRHRAPRASASSKSSPV